MKKLLTVVGILLVIGAAGSYFFLSNKAVPDLKKANVAEVTGNFQEALSLYAGALLEITPSMDLPDVNNSKFMSPAVWKKTVEKYVAWISIPSQKSRDDIDSILKNIEMCSLHTDQENRMIGFVAKGLSVDQYISEWNNAFFATASLINPEHRPLAEGNHVRNISIVKFSSVSSYTYELNLVNLTSGKRTSFVLFPESSVFLLAVPGKHLLVGRSSVKFSSGEMWRSHYTASSLVIPDEASLVCADLRTSVPRK